MLPLNLYSACIEHAHTASANAGTWYYIIIWVLLQLRDHKKFPMCKYPVLWYRYYSACFCLLSVFPVIVIGASLIPGVDNYSSREEL